MQLERIEGFSPRRVLFAVIPLLAVGAAAAAPADHALDEAIAAVTPDMMAVRHRLHANPELGYQEKETAALVAERLRALGLEVKTGVAHTGVVGLLRGGRPGPVVAVRADMDALPVTEETDLPFKSTRRGEYLGQEVGLAHACGHDVHTAVALGVAAVLAARREELPGTVKFLFQPAEEGPPPGELPGAVLMMEQGALDDPRPEAIFALHAFPDLEVGQLGYKEGATMAAVDQFEIELIGRQSHGAYPHQGVDPVVLAAHAITAFQTIRSRTLPALEPSVVSVGIVRGGERFNIIPERVHLEGTVRTFSEGTRAVIERRMKEILDGLTAAWGGRYEMSYRSNAPPTINDPALAQRVRPFLEEAAPGRVVEVEPSMGGEDFAYFANQVPGFYFRLGVNDPDHPSGGLHTPTFRAADGAIPVGIRAMVSVVLGYLEGGGAGS